MSTPEEYLSPWNNYPVCKKCWTITTRCVCTDKEDDEMANPSKNKGTAAESAVVRYLRDQWGIATAERIALAGAADQGDVRVFPGLHLEVKAGNAAHNASRSQCEKWMQEAEREAVNARCPVYLVVKRKGTTDPAKWRFFCRLSDLCDNEYADALVELQFDEAMDVFRNNGFTKVGSW